LDLAVSDLIIARVNAPRRRPRVKLAIIILVVAYVLWIGLNAAFNARELQRRMVCGSNLKGIGTSFKIYSGEGWDGKTPAVEWLIARGYIEPRQAICPSSGDIHSNYVLVALPPAGPLDNRTIIAYEPRSNHRDGGNAVFADGHAEFLRGDDYDRLVAALSLRIPP
jgi:prepilin-type processing-associated H-X9-DG protein